MITEQDFEDHESMKSREEKLKDIEEKKGLSSFQDCMPVFMLDNMDPSEYWRYLYEET